MKNLIPVLVLCALAACVPSSLPTLTVMSHDSFAVSEQVIAAFEETNQVRVAFLKAGDTGEALSKAILSADAPLADLFYGVDNTFLSRALEAGIFEAYASPLLASIPDEYQLDPDDHLLPVDFGDVCINYDRGWFEENDLQVPQSLEDLLDPAYRGLLVVENPATSSPGLAFLMATVAHFGEPGYLSFWEALRENGLVVVDGWETAYFTNFSGSSGAGPQPLVVSYGSSPAFEAYYSEEPVTEAPTASIVGPGTCFRQVEFIGILRGTQQRALAEKFIDFVLDVQFQEDMLLQMSMFPVNSNASLPEEFIRYVQFPEQPAVLDPDVIAEKCDQWIDDWTEAVIR